MIRFCDEYSNIIKIELVRGCLYNGLNLMAEEDDQTALSPYSQRTLSIFGRKELKREIERLLETLNSPKLYNISDYHWLILHDLMHANIEEHDIHAASEDVVYSGAAVGAFAHDTNVRFLVTKSSNPASSERLVVDVPGEPPLRPRSRPDLVAHLEGVGAELASHGFEAELSPDFAQG